MSDKICTKCFFTVYKYFRFRKKCLGNDKEQRKLLRHNVDAPYSKRKIPQLSYKRKKRRTSETEYESDSTFHDLDEIDDDYEENLIEFFEREQVDIEEEKLVKIENLDKADVEVEISKSDKIEEELRQLIEGSLSKEQAQAENIIIHIQNDEEDENETLTKLTDLKLPIVIKPLASQKPNAQPKNVIIDYEKDVSSSEENYFKGAMSDIGMFEASPIKYIFDYEFCILDGYVFEYRLCKGKVR